MARVVEVAMGVWRVLIYANNYKVMGRRLSSVLALSEHGNY